MAFPNAPQPAMPEPEMLEPMVPVSPPESADTEPANRPAGEAGPPQLEPEAPSDEGTMAADAAGTAVGESEPPVAKPAAKDLAALSEALQTARTALGEQNFDVADEQLATARKLVKLPEHRAKLERLEQLAHYVRGFWDAVERSVSGFEGTEEFMVGSTVVVVVEASPESITIKFDGLRRKYPIRQLPPGLAVAIADQWFDPSKPENLVFKGAYVAVMRNADEQDRAKGRGWWEQAIAQGVDIRELLPVYDDTYDFGG